MSDTESNIGIQLGGPDRVSIAFLQNWPGGMFVSHLVDNSNTRIQQFLVERYFDDGAALFGRESFGEINDFRSVCGSLHDVSDEVISAILQYFVNRVRNYSHIENIALAEITRGQVDSVDEYTPTTCLGHGGRKVNVFDAALRIRWMKTLDSVEYGVLAYGVDFGFPPFDILCSCRMFGVISGTDYEPYEALSRRRVTRTKWDRLNHIDFILRKTSPSDMSEEKFSDLFELMLQVSEELVENPDPQSKLERRTGEALAARGRKEEAILHLEKALRIRPKVGVKKLLIDLKANK